MRLRRWPLATMCLLVASALAASGHAAVVVLANRTAAKIDFVTVDNDGTQQQHSLAARDVLPIPTTDTLGVTFQAGGVSRRYLLHPSCIQFFVGQQEKLDLVQIALPGIDQKDAPAPPPAAKPAGQHAVRRARDASGRPARAGRAAHLGKTVCANGSKRPRPFSSSAVVCGSRWCRWGPGRPTTRYRTSTSRCAISKAKSALRRPAWPSVSPALYQHTEGRTHLGGTRGAAAPLHPAARVVVARHQVGAVGSAGPRTGPFSRAPCIVPNMTR